MSDPKQNRFCPLKYHETLLLCVRRFSLHKNTIKFFLYTDKNVEHPTKLNISAQTKTTLLPYSADPIAGGVDGFPNSTADCNELRESYLADFLQPKFSRTIYFHGYFAGFSRQNLTENVRNSVKVGRDLSNDRLFLKGLNSGGIYTVVFSSCCRGVSSLGSLWV